MREESKVPVEDSWARLNFSPHIIIVAVVGMIDDHFASLSLSKEYSMGFFPDGLSPSDQPQLGLIYLGTSCAP